MVDVYWADMNGDKITHADLGDSVQMIKVGGGSGNFSIYENDDSFFEFLIDVDDDIREVEGGIIGDNYVGVWTITQADLDKSESGDYDDFRFSIGDATSESLNVSLIRSDDRMNVTIVSPTCGIHFNESEFVDVVIVADDADDIISGTLTIGSEAPMVFNNSGVSLVGHPFSVAGNVQIVADAVNSRGKRSRTISSVMVLDTPYEVGDKYVAACIKSPANYASFDESVVKFDASTSRGIEIDSSSVAQVIEPGSSRLNWYWTFYPEGITRNFIGNGDSLLAYSFSAEFPVAGDNSARLRLELV